MLSPVRLRPRPVERVWGGQRIARAFDRDYPRDRPIGEAWEVYGELEVAEGEFQGRTLDELTGQLGPDLVGRHSDPDQGFPILTKWLDCNDWLSVQVHPDDRLARELTGDPRSRGKTECWFIWEGDGELLHGLASGVELKEWARREGSSLVDGLRRVRPRPGDLLYTAAGTVHALGPGLLLYEIQQSSDLTYRLYDWDRLGLDGQARQTHPLEARRCVLEVVPAPAEVTATSIRSPFFQVERREQGGEVATDGSSFGLATLLEGGTVGDLPAAKGETVLIPAMPGRCRIQTPGSWLYTCLSGGI